jgi:branched-chain amino acid transport system ATP-binding protein
LQLAEHFKDFRIEDFVLLGRQHWTSKSVWACGFGFPAVIRREREQVRFVADLLDRFGLSEYRGERLRELPYGTQRLVDLARAMATQPRLLLLDEPTSGSSESEREALHRHVRELRSAGVTALVVDHDVGFVSQCSDRLLAMALGRALAVGTAEQVLADAEVISSYLGRPQESLAEGGSPDRSDDSDLSPK